MPFKETGILVGERSMVKPLRSKGDVESYTTIMPPQSKPPKLKALLLEYFRRHWYKNSSRPAQRVDCTRAQRTVRAETPPKEVSFMSSAGLRQLFLQSRNAHLHVFIWLVPQTWLWHGQKPDSRKLSYLSQAKLKSEAMACIPAHEVSLIIEETASMDNWEALIDNASSAISKDLKDESKAYKLKLAYEELISNIIRLPKRRAQKSNISEGIADHQKWKRHIIHPPNWRQGLNLILASVEIWCSRRRRYRRKTNRRARIFLIKQSVDVVCYEWEQGINKNQHMQLD